jgi:short-subunit dehydrogenase
MDLRGRCVLLTGASGGIGSALADEMVGAGAGVIAIGRSRERLQPLVARHRPGRITPLVADINDEAGRAAIAVAARAAAITPSLLVLAHAQSSFGLFEEQGDGDLAAMVTTNLVAPMLLIRSVLPMLRLQTQAAVVAVGSTFGSLAFPGFAAYSASKFGLRGLVEGLGREYADTAVRFQYLSPRATRTPFNTSAVDALNRELKTAVDEPQDVARALLAAIVAGDRRRQLGWPEKLFARINGAFPALVDAALTKQLAIVRRHAGRHFPLVVATEKPDENLAS